MDTNQQDPRPWQGRGNAFSNQNEPHSFVRRLRRYVYNQEGSIIHFAHTHGPLALAGL